MVDRVLTSRSSIVDRNETRKPVESKLPAQIRKQMACRNWPGWSPEPQQLLISGTGRLISNLLPEQDYSEESGPAVYVDLLITPGVNVLHQHHESIGRKGADPLYQSYGRLCGKRNSVYCIHESMLR
jgi:hypothetical protein